MEQSMNAFNRDLDYAETVCYEGKFFMATGGPGMKGHQTTGNALFGFATSIPAEQKRGKEVCIDANKIFPKSCINTEIDLDIHD